MNPSPSARLLAQSLLALLCGSAACVDREPAGGGVGARVGQAGGGGDASTEAGAAGAFQGRPGGAAGALAGVAGASGGVGGASGGGGAFTPGEHPCVSPVPVLIAGEPSGMAECADGSLARLGGTKCRLQLSAEEKCEAVNDPPKGGGIGRCDDPCFGGAHGRPKKPWGGSGYYCEYFCETDADCPSGDLCACDRTGAGMCVPGGCDGDAACGPGGGCRVAHRAGVCFGPTAILRCLEPTDGCVTGADCGGAAPGRACGVLSGNEQRCWSGAAGCGRPLVVAARALVAALVPTGAWSAA